MFKSKFISSYKENWIAIHVNYRLLWGGFIDPSYPCWLKYSKKSIYAFDPKTLYFSSHLLLHHKNQLSNPFVYSGKVKK